MTEQDINLGSLLAEGWVKFAARPFSLFIASGWHECYKEYVSQITKADLSISDGIFIQEPDGVICNYRKASQLLAVKNDLLNRYFEDRSELLRLLSRARELNIRAKEALNQSQSMGNYEEIFDLLCNVAVFGALLPRFVLEILEENHIDDKEIHDWCEGLRGVSLYPKMVTDLLIPCVTNILERANIPNAEIRTSFITVQELKENDFSKLKERMDCAEKGKLFTYVGNAKCNEISWRQNIIRVSTKKAEVAGKAAFPGFVKGRARKCLTLDGSDIKDFEVGDILVSINSNPNLLHWIKKSSAIVSDEGGIICHAAIVARELQIPCVIGTGNATKVIEDGAMIEVDANIGTVKTI